MDPDIILNASGHREYPLSVRRWAACQAWRNIIFLHWQFPPDSIAALIPQHKNLRLDLFEGKAWLSLVGFTVKDIGVRHFPPFPAKATFYELNLRTYVTDGTRKGIYFISIWTNSFLAMMLNRIGGLPYSLADVAMKDEHSFKYKRGPDRMDINYTVHPATEKTALDVWLTERYFDYQKNGGRLYCFPIHHRAWPLQPVTISGKISFRRKAGVVLTEQNMALAQYATGVDALLWTPEKA